MPLYRHECQECTNEFDVMCSIDDRKKSHECEFCGAVNSKNLITGCNFNLPGDEWVSKNLRVQKQMEGRRVKAKEKAGEQAREQPGMTLAPNVEGERTESWADAQQLARDKGKDPNSYTQMVARERKQKSA